MANHFPYFRYISKRFVRGKQVGLRNDFKQGHTGPVKIYAGVIFIDVVDAFAGVFFEVNPVEQYTSFFAVYFNWNRTIFADRGGMLCYLVTFRKIGIEIIFSCEIIITYNFAIICQPQFNSQLYGFLIHYRQSARMSKGNSADISVWRIAKLCTITTK